MNSMCNVDDCTQRRIQLVSMVIDALPDDTLKIVMAEVGGLDVLISAVRRFLQGRRRSRAGPRRNADHQCAGTTAGKRWLAGLQALDVDPKVSENIFSDYLLNSSDCAANPKLEICSGCGNARDFDLIAAAVRRQHPRNPSVGSTEACVENLDRHKPNTQEGDHESANTNGFAHVQFTSTCLEPRDAAFAVDSSHQQTKHNERSKPQPPTAHPAPLFPFHLLPFLLSFSGWVSCWMGT